MSYITWVSVASNDRWLGCIILEEEAPSDGIALLRKLAGLELSIPDDAVSVNQASQLESDIPPTELPALKANLNRFIKAEEAKELFRGTLVGDDGEPVP